MTLWDSLLYLSQAYAQVLIKVYSTCYKTSSLLRALCDVCAVFFSQVIDMFTYWRQMVPVCHQPHFLSMSKWAAKEFPSKLCQSEWPLTKPRHDVYLNQIENCIFWQRRASEKELWMWEKREKNWCCCCQPVSQLRNCQIYTKPLHKARRKVLFFQR